MKLNHWQQTALDTIKKTKGLKPVIMTGRNIGKSYMSSSAFQRLWDDLHARPVEDLKLSEGTVYGSQYYTVEPVGGRWAEMELWCHQTFGETGSIWQETKNLTPEPHKRWYMNNRKFWFQDEADRTLFILKWR